MERGRERRREGDGELFILLGAGYSVGRTNTHHCGTTTAAYKYPAYKQLELNKYCILTIKHCRITIMITKVQARCTYTFFYYNYIITIK